MHGKTTVALLSAVMAGQVAADVAPKTSGNPPNVAYKATIDKPGFADAVLPGELKGHICASAPQDGKGVKFDVHFKNLPAEGGPFTYHLHKAPVPADGNCTETLTHLDPYGAGAEVKCDESKPETCEVGDLSGKHGSIEGQDYSMSYHDPYASTKEGDEAYFGDLSFVIHYANSTRLACANFAKVDKAPYPTGGAPNSTVHPTGGAPTSSAPTMISSMPIEPSSSVPAIPSSASVPDEPVAPTAEPAPEPTATPPPADSATQMTLWSVPAMLLGAAAVAFAL